MIFMGNKSGLRFKYDFTVWEPVYVSEAWRTLHLLIVIQQTIPPAEPLKPPESVEARGSGRDTRAGNMQVEGISDKRLGGRGTAMSVFLSLVNHFILLGFSYSFVQFLLHVYTRLIFSLDSPTAHRSWLVTDVGGR